MGSRYTFLYVGRLAPEKRVAQVVDAFRVASEMVPRGVIHLVIAGAGPREAELRAAAPPGVTFLGVLDRRSRLPDLYANCDAFVFASVTETLGLVVLEAMASGLPVIAVPEGGVRDHLRDGRNGIACRAGDVSGMALAMVRIADRVGPEPAAGSRRQAHRGAAELGPGDRATGAELSRGVGAVSAGRLDRPGRGRGQPLTCSGVGEPAGDRGALAPLALGGDPAAMRLHQVLHDGESQAGASFVARPRAIRPVEPLEDPRQVLAGDAGAVVVHGEGNPVPLPPAEAADAPHRPACGGASSPAGW